MREVFGFRSMPILSRLNTLENTVPRTIPRCSDIFCMVEKLHAQQSMRGKVESFGSDKRMVAECRIAWVAYGNRERCASSIIGIMKWTMSVAISICKVDAAPRLFFAGIVRLLQQIRRLIVVSFSQPYPDHGETVCTIENVGLSVLSTVLSWALPHRKCESHLPGDPAVPTQYYGIYRVVRISAILSRSLCEHR